MHIIDLRSDTVTKPTPEMYEAMARAELGDDVFGDDPTVIRLEEMAAELMGKERALFVPSGTMGNLIAVLTHCRRGEEAIIGNKAHTFLYEVGGMAALGGVHPATVPNQPDGTLKIEDVKQAIRNPADVHQPLTRLICLENTHNATGGMPLSESYTREISNIAKAYGLLLHIDGARIFHAAAALNVTPKALAEPADSITFCLSKALCAPLGSLLCGTEDFIAQARRLRKQLGGGMRQVGVVAAAGIVALQTTAKRVGEDHIRAKTLARGLDSMSGITVDPAEPPSNMIYFNVLEKGRLTADQMRQKLLDEGIKVMQVSDRRIRMIVHYWIDDKDVNRTIEAFARITA